MCLSFLARRVKREVERFNCSFPLGTDPVIPWQPDDPYAEEEGSTGGGSPAAAVPEGCRRGKGMDHREDEDSRRRDVQGGRVPKSGVG